MTTPTTSSPTTCGDVFAILSSCKEGTMDYLTELYDTKGACIGSFRTETPMQAIARLGQFTIDLGSLTGFVTATCYYKAIPQWELEIK